MLMRSVGVFAVLLSFAFPRMLRAETGGLFIGTGATGIYYATFDFQTGKVGPSERVAETPRPTFLTLDPRQQFLYSINELSGTAQGGPRVSAWKVEEAGKLTLLNSQPAGGDGPCYVDVSGDGRYAAIANYGSGSVSLFPIQEDGALGEATGHVQHVGSSVNPQRQSGPHAHISLFDPSGKRVVVADLGTDHVYFYDIGPEGDLQPSRPADLALPPGSGPRHVAFSNEGDYLLVLGELSGTISSFEFSPPSVSFLQTLSTLAENYPKDQPRAAAEILFHPRLPVVYASNRGPQEIAVFQFDPQQGMLTRLSAVSSGGKTPRNFRLSPDGKFMIAANQNSDRLTVLMVDQQSGELALTEHAVTVPQPMCVKVVGQPPNL